jgi:PIN domain nuclease of toxin-antitoxin system
MLVAQAMVEGLTLITADRDVQSYSAPLLWAGR